jgi:hypothetical protein
VRAANAIEIAALPAITHPRANRSRPGHSVVDRDRSIGYPGRTPADVLCLVIQMCSHTPSVMATSLAASEGQPAVT